MSAQRLRPGFRKPRRVSLTMPEQPYLQLIERSVQEGRSISNLAAFLLEKAIHELLEEESRSGSINAKPKSLAGPCSSPSSGNAMNLRCLDL